MWIPDTVSLLQECDAGAKMAVTSIDDVLEEVKDQKMKKTLQKSKKEHEKLGNQIHSMLYDYGKPGKEPNLMAKGMSWIKTNMKMGMNYDSDSTAADLITDGCNMGIKSLNKYLNEYENAETEAKTLCKKLISTEENLCRDLQEYL